MSVLKLLAACLYNFKILLGHQAFPADSPDDADERRAGVALLRLLLACILTGTRIVFPLCSLCVCACELSVLHRAAALVEMIQFCTSSLLISDVLSMRPYGWRERMDLEAVEMTSAHSVWS